MSFPRLEPDDDDVGALTNEASIGIDEEGVMSGMGNTPLTTNHPRVASQHVIIIHSPSLRPMRNPSLHQHRSCLGIALEYNHSKLTSIY